MSKPFHERFDISIDVQDARLRFVNRVKNEIWEDFYVLTLRESERYGFARYVVSRIGARYSHHHNLEHQIGDDLERNLEAIEHGYAHFVRESAFHRAKALDQKVRELVGITEIDLGFEWRDGKFHRTGARLLDEKLINDPLKWLRDAHATNVTEHFEKGLHDLLLSKTETARRIDVVIGMYKALEALAKNVLGNDKDLSGNREAFISRVTCSPIFSPAEGAQFVARRRIGGVDEEVEVYR